MSDQARAELRNQCLGEPVLILGLRKPVLDVSLLTNRSHIQIFRFDSRAPIGCEVVLYPQRF